MAFRRSDPPPADPPGLRGEFQALLEECSDHLHTRGELLALEAREAGEILKRRARLAILSIGLMGSAYLLLLAALIGILGSLFAGQGFSLANWTGAALLLAVLHLIPGLLFFGQYRKISKNCACFTATLNELRKDQQWLSREKTN